MASSKSGSAWLKWVCRFYGSAPWGSVKECMLLTWIACCTPVLQGSEHLTSLRNRADAAMHCTLHSSPPCNAHRYSRLLGLMVVMYVLEPLLSLVYIRKACEAGEKVQAALRLEAFRTLLMQRIEFFDKHRWVGGRTDRAGQGAGSTLHCPPCACAARAWETLVAQHMNECCKMHSVQPA
jgi:hypothetical protein